MFWAKDLNNEASKFYITGTDKYSKCLVENFNQLNSGCSILIGLYFTSIALADWTTTTHFSIVGTMRLDRKGIPKEIKSMERREEKLIIHGYQKNGEKNIVVLTTMYTSVSVTKGHSVNPNAHTFYDHTKGGVDVMDLVSTHETTKMKNRGCPINVLAFISNSIRTDAKNYPY